MAVNVESLEYAIQKLEESIKFSKSQLAVNDREIFEQFRTAVIKCFEYTFELSWKTLRRRLEKNAAEPDLIREMSYRTMIRTGAEQGFISDPAVWFKYRDDRNLTSHTYEETTAARVYIAALDFLGEAKKILEKLKERESDS